MALLVLALRRESVALRRGTRARGRPAFGANRKPRDGGQNVCYQARNGSSCWRSVASGSAPIADPCGDNRDRPRRVWEAVLCRCPSKRRSSAGSDVPPEVGANAVHFAPTNCCAPVPGKQKWPGAQLLRPAEFGSSSLTLNACGICSTHICEASFSKGNTSQRIFFAST